MARRMVDESSRQMKVLHDREARFRASQGAKHRPLIEVRQPSPALSVATATGVGIPWSARDEEMSWGSGFEMSTDNKTLYVPEPGLYIVTVYAVWGANATGYRQISISTDLNGALVVSRVPAVSGNDTHQTLNAPAYLTPDDGVGAVVSQTSGSTLFISVASRIYVARIT